MNSFPVAALQRLLLAGLLASAPAAQAGPFIFADATNGVDIVLHPTGYNGTGGVLNVNVCITPGTPNEAAMTQSMRNMIAVYNQLLPTTGNLRSNFLPAGTLDFESVALHELGHCIGKAHVNAASESGLSGSNQNYTKATRGANGNFNLKAGTDTIIGSADDRRKDDINLHWYRIANNNPFTIDYSTVDFTTYARAKASLPLGDRFAANGDRTVGTSVLSTPHTEAVMQQGTFFSEIQRTLTPDGVATVRLGMSGIDEIQGTSDDYTLHLNLATSNCDINVSFDIAAGQGLAFCSVSGTGIGGNHLSIVNPSMHFNAVDYNWFFNTAAPCSKTLALTQNQWTMFSLPCSVGISTGNTVVDVLGDDLAGVYDTNWAVYERDAAGDVYTKLAPTDVLATGKGYWVFTDQPGQSFNVQGQFNGSPDTLLRGVAGGRSNLVGHPFDFNVDWSAVQIVDGALVQDLATAVAEGDLSETYHVWNGNAYDAFDASTLGMIGTLRPFDGIWVKTFKDGIYLRVPYVVSAVFPEVVGASAAGLAPVTRAGSSATRPGAASGGNQRGDGSWFVRVIVESGDFQDSGNVLGQLPDASDGQDKHDLVELEPFDDSYLTVIFPHDDWAGDAWAYTSDFHAVSRKPRGEWVFAVLSSIDVSQVSLRLEGPRKILRRASLTDLETGRKVRFNKGAYTFEASPGVRYFAFRIGGR